MVNFIYFSFLAFLIVSVASLKHHTLRSQSQRTLKPTTLFLRFVQIKHKSNGRSGHHSRHYEMALDIKLQTSVRQCLDLIGQAIR